MPDYPLETPGGGETDFLADWAEAMLLIEGRSFLSRAVLKDRYAGGLMLEDSEDLEATIDLLLTEVRRRRDIAPSFYPFDRDELRNGISLRNEVNAYPYQFLLWLSISPAFRALGRQGETEGKFNNLVRQAVERYLGNGSIVVETSTAARRGERTFRELLGSIAARMCLRYGAFREPRTARRDGGVDLIGWRPFADARSAFIVLLCQCTVQKEWEVKSTDISTKLWMQWIDFVRDPLTALAVPFAVPISHEKWIEVRCNVDVIFDRLRLSELLSAGRFQGIDEIREWCDSERALLYT